MTCILDKKINDSPLITIVIPNYNNAKFVARCLDSVVCQDYHNKEILIIDDGSTDNSVNVIKKYISQHSEVDITLMEQKNSGATVARNKGIEKSSGEYIIFLDSDDMLCQNALSKLVAAACDHRVDLVIGSYSNIDKNGSFLGNRAFTDRDILLDAREGFSMLVNIDPLPVNKIYSLSLIKRNGLRWDDVRIAQDLDFYFKYLALCRKVMIITEKIGKYRIVPGSISRTYDSKIYDIVVVFNNIKKFYYKNGMAIYYDKYIPFQVLKHYNFQISKQIFYKKREDRENIIDFFFEAEKKNDCAKCVVDCGKIRKKIYLKKRLKFFVTSGIYCFFSKKLISLKNILRHVMVFLDGDDKK